MKGKILLTTILGVFYCNYEMSYSMNNDITQYTQQQGTTYTQNMRAINNVFGAMLNIENDVMRGTEEYTPQLDGIGPYIADKAFKLYFNHVVKIGKAKLISVTEAIDLMIIVLEKVKNMSGKLSEYMEQALSEFKSYKTDFDSIDKSDAQDPVKDIMDKAFSQGVVSGRVNIAASMILKIIAYPEIAGIPETIPPLQKFEIVEFGFPKDSIPFMIKSDDVDGLIKLMSGSSMSEIDNINVSEYNVQLDDGLIRETSLIDLAALYGSEKCFKYLLLNDAIIGESTFINAVIGGNLEIIRIIEQTIGINDAKFGFKSALIYDRYDLANWMLNIRPVKLDSRMFYYVNNNQIMDLLISRGKFPNIREFTLEGRTPQPSDMLGLLVENGADVNLKDHYGEIPLFAIIRDNNVKLAELMIENGADVNLVNNRGQTPFSLAKSQEMKDMLSKYID